MTYNPKESREKELEALALKKIVDLFKSVDKVSAMYVEPGDIVLVKIEAENDEVLSSSRHVIKALFPDNEVLILGKGTQIELVKKQLTNK